MNDGIFAFFFATLCLKFSVLTEYPSCTRNPFFKDMVTFYVICMLRHHKKDTVAQTSNEQTPGRYVYIEEYTTQLCGD